MRVVFRAANANTGATTVNVSGLGVKDIRTQAGAALPTGDISTDRDVELRYDASLGYFFYGSTADADTLDGSHLADITALITAAEESSAVNAWQIPASSGAGVTLPDSFQTAPGDFEDLVRVAVPTSVQAFAGKTVNISMEMFGVLASGFQRDVTYRVFFGVGLHNATANTEPAEYDIEFNDADGTATDQTSNFTLYTYRRGASTYVTADSQADGHSGTRTVFQSISSLTQRHTTGIRLYNFTLPGGFDSFLIRGQRMANRTGPEPACYIHTSAPAGWTATAGIRSEVRFELMNTLT